MDSSLGLVLLSDTRFLASLQADSDDNDEACTGNISAVKLASVGNRFECTDYHCMGSQSASSLAVGRRNPLILSSPESCCELSSNASRIREGVG